MVYREKKYALSDRAIEIFKKEGYVILKVVDNKKELEAYETMEIKDGVSLPKGFQMLLFTKEVRDYGSIILVEENT